MYICENKNHVMKYDPTILEKVDWNIINKYIEIDNIMLNKHPDYDIWILNYTKKCQYEKHWDLYTTSCRGLVIDKEGNILARCMKKFFNYEEHDPSEIDMNQEFEIFEKLDGSMIEIFYYEEVNEWIIVSRGSFISDQALEAKKMIDSKPNVLDNLDKKYTFVFEVLFKSNQIVINYGNTYDLVLLTTIETKTGKELSYDDLVEKYSKCFTIVKKYDLNNITDLSDLKKLEEDNKEGFVVKFPNFRTKVKYSTYVKLHKIITGVSNLGVWEYLKEGKNFDEIINNVPDEWFNWLNKTINSLKVQYNAIETEALNEYIRIYQINDIVNGKEFAAEVKNHKYKTIIFNMFNKKHYEDIIWNMIRPKFCRGFGGEDL